jgi:CHASE2 domain-containing sensor protein
MTQGQVHVYRGIVFLIAIVAALGFGWLVQQSPRMGPELAAEDTLARTVQRPARSDVVILAIDDATVAKYGPFKSWSRATLADGLRTVESGKPKTVVLDLALPERKGAGDRSLWKVIANNQNVVLGMGYDADRSTTAYTPDDVRSLLFLEKYAIADKLTLGPKTQAFPYYLFQPPVSDFTGSSRGVGVFVRETDPDGVIRDARMFYKSAVEYPQGTAPLHGDVPVSRLADGAPVVLPNLALVAAQRVFEVEKESARVVSGNIVAIAGPNPPVLAPVDEQGKMLIRYSGPAGHVLAYSFLDVVNGKVKPEFFTGRTVIVGATASNDPASDLRNTPVGPMYRVEITANALTTVLDRSYAGRFTPQAPGAMILVGLVSGLAMMFMIGWRVTLSAVGLLIGWLSLCWGMFAMGHTVLPILPGIVVILLTYVTAIALSHLVFRPVPLEAPPTYVPPPPGAVTT